MERANEAVVPTVRLTSVEAAYWCEIRGRYHLRWVIPHDEDTLLDALARLHAAGADTVGEGSRYVGSFRAHGLVVPVWDLAEGTSAEALEEPVDAFAGRLAEALADTSPLDDAAAAGPGRPAQPAAHPALSARAGCVPAGRSAVRTHQESCCSASPDLGYRRLQARALLHPPSVALGPFHVRRCRPRGSGGPCWSAAAAGRG